MKIHNLVQTIPLLLLLFSVLPLNSLLLVPFVVGSSAETIHTFKSVDKREIFGSKHVADELIVKFKRNVTDEEILSIRVGQAAEEIYVSPFSSARRWNVPPSKTVEEWANFFNKLPMVEYAEPNYLRSALWYPNDPLYEYQWNFDDDHTLNPGGSSSNPYGGVNGGGIGMEEAWATSNGNENVVVAVIDTGVAYEDYPIPSHEQGTVKPSVTDYEIAPDLASTTFWLNEDEIPGNGVDDDGNGFIDDINGWDFVNDDAHPNDNNGHGTHVTGTIAQTSDNELGAAGIAFNTKVMPIKVLDYSGQGYDIDLADAIYYAVNNGAKIINLSLGGPDSSSTLEDAVSYAYNNGVVVIAASGNDGIKSVHYPAAYDAYVIAVGATRYDETRAYYSNFGSSLDLVAPGGDVTVDQNVDGYGDGILQQTFQPYVEPEPPLPEEKADPTDWSYWFFQGTSMATPHTSGVAALLLAIDPTLTPSETKNILESTAEDLGAAGKDNLYGWGLIDAKAACTLASNTPPEASNLTIAPDLPVTSDDLVASYDYYDAEGDPESGSEILWYKDAELQIDLNNSLTVDSSLTTKGQEWNFTITPNDSMEFGSPVTSTTVTITNSPPTIDVYSPTETTLEINEGESIEFTHVSSDLDNDMLTYSWTLDTVEVASTENWTYVLDFWSQGMHTIGINVTDTGESSASQEWSANVINVQYRNLTVLASANGTTNPSPDTYQYALNTNASVNAIPDLTYKLDHWMLNGSDIGSANPAIVNMTDNFELEPIFAEVTYNLTVNIVGNGYFTADPDQTEYVEGTNVELTAFAAENWEFAGWSGDATGADNPITLQMIDDLEVTSTFEPNPTPEFTINGVTTWYWTDNTTINTITKGDVDKDGSTEIVTGGYYFDGTRDVAQLVVWNGSTLTVDQLTTWYWGDNTRINSIAIGNLDEDEAQEIVTGGYYFDSVRKVAQLVVWDGATLAVEGLTNWYWTNDTEINSVKIADINGDGSAEIITGGYYNDEVRDVAQLVVWNGETLAVERLTTWYWSGDTRINTIDVENVANDHQLEIITGGYYTDGRRIAQLVVWDGLTLSPESISTWYWTNDTEINSVVADNVDYDLEVEIVTGGYYNDNSRDIAQLVVWSNDLQTVENLTNWYWTSDTRINSISVDDANSYGSTEIITAGYFNDLTRDNAQLVVWNATTLSVNHLTSWYWTNNTRINSIAIGNVDDDYTSEVITGGSFYDSTRNCAQTTIWEMYEAEKVQVGIYPSGGVNIWDYESELNVEFNHILHYQKVKSLDYKKVVQFLDLDYEVILILIFEDTYANLQAIANGEYDSYLINLAEDIVDDGRTIWLRPLHEFNGDWYNWGTLYPGNSIADFIPAWKHIVQLFRDHHAPVKFQLNYNRYNGKADTTPFSAFWPGDDYVDMAVITSYNRAYTDEWHQYWRTFAEEFDNAYNQVTQLTEKPIGIAEMSSTSYGGDKPQWIIDAFNSIAYDYPRVQQISWFLTNKTVSDVLWDWDLNTQEEKNAFIQGMQLISTIRR